MALNLNAPVTDYAISWPNGPAQSCQQPYWCSMTERSQDQTQGRRGKQYEIDQCQPGEVDVSFANKDGALDPLNTTSPFAPWVIPYRLFRWREQWSPTLNLLTQNQATAGEATLLPAPVEQPWTLGGAPDTVSVWQNALAPTTIVASGSAWQGAQVYNHAVQASATYPFNVVGMQAWSVLPSTNAAGPNPAFTSQYSITTHARAATGITATAAVAVTWVNASGAVISTTVGTASTLATGTSWTTLTLTTAAPVGACGAVAYLSLRTGPAATSWTLQSDGYDVRKGTTPGYSTPGVWYPIFTGYIERWPQRWTSNGQYGISDLIAVDLFAPFSQRDLLAPIIADLLALNPNFLYPLDEGAGSTSFADLTGTRDQLQATTSSRPAYVNVSAGATVESTDSAPQGTNIGALTGAFLGSPGPVVTSAFTDPPTGAFTGATINSYIGLNANQTSKPVGVPATGTAWTRLLAVRGGPGNTSTTSIGELVMVSATADNINAVEIRNDGTVDSGASWTLQAMVFSPAGQQAALLFPGLSKLYSNTPATAGGLPYIDSDWHLIGVSLSADGKTLTTWCDDAPAPNTASIATPMSFTSGPGGDLYLVGWTGQAALICELPQVMDATTWGNLYQSWRNAWAATSVSAESSDTRYARILAWLGFAGPTRISAGMSTTYGPAVDIAVSGGSPTKGLQALQNVVDTESGQHFVGADGAAVFQSRADRYNKTPTLVFGENTAGGEIPYLDAQLDFDPTRIGNDAQVTAQYGNALYRQQDGPVSNPASSQGKYGSITISRTVNSLDPIELNAAAQNLLYQNKNPLSRLQSLVINPSSNPTVWAALLGLELGVCVQVNRRPPGAPMISMTGFVEQITWTRDGKTKKVTCTLQISNNQLKNGFAQLDTVRLAPDAGAATLNTALSTTSGTTVVLATATGQTFTTTAGSYPFDITIDAEQITLNSAPSGSTSPQTFTGVTRHVNGTAPATHSAGAAVNLVQAALVAY